MQGIVTAFGLAVFGLAAAAGFAGIMALSVQDDIWALLLFGVALAAAAVLRRLSLTGRGLT